jgi:hypothetical protein
MCRRDGLLHPRDKRSALQVFGEVGRCSVREGLGLIGLVAPEAFPGPVPCNERAEVVVAFKRGRPDRSGGVVCGVHLHLPGRTCAASGMIALP